MLRLAESRIARLVVICLAACLVCPAQETAEEDPLVFRTGTTLIEFTLIALDGKGNPVTDLKPEEIEIKDKGQRRDVAVFRYEGGAFEEARSPAPLPAGAFTNRAELTPGPPRNITAIVLDTLNTPPDKQGWVRSQVMKYLLELTDDTRIALYGLGEQMLVLHDFTDDTASLRERVKEIDLELQSQVLINVERTVAEAEVALATTPGDPELLKQILTTEIETNMLFNAQARLRRTQKTLASLKSLGDHLAGIPGRKSIVWIGGGISILSMGTGAGGGFQSYEAWVTDTARQLAHQGVTMYMVDAKGLEGGVDSSQSAAVAVFRGSRTSPFERQQRAEDVSSDPLPVMYEMAKVTGGRVFWQTNDMARGMKAVESDIRGTYAVGFYAVGDPDDRWHGLNVKVKRKGVRIMHPKGYESKPVTQTAQEWTDEEWTPLIYNPLGSTSIRLDVRCELTENDGAKTINLGLGMVADDLYFRENGEAVTAEVEIAIADKSTAGQARLYREEVKANTAPGNVNDLNQIRYRRSWELTPGTSTIRVMVRDRVTGLYGVIDVPVKDIPISSGNSGSP